MQRARPLSIVAMVLVGLCVASGCGPRGSSAYDWSKSGSGTMGGGGGGGGSSGVGAEGGTGDVTILWTIAGQSCAQWPSIHQITIKLLNNNTHRTTAHIVPCTNNGTDGVGLKNLPNGLYAHKVFGQTSDGQTLFYAEGQGDLFDGHHPGLLKVNLLSNEDPPSSGWPGDGSYDDGSGDDSYDDGSYEGWPDDGSYEGPPDDGSYEGSPDDGSYEGPPDDGSYEGSPDDGGDDDDGSTGEDSLRHGLTHGVSRHGKAHGHPVVNGRASGL